MSKWYQGEGNSSDVVLFSKVRLARNLADSPFPSRMSDEIRKGVTKKIYATVKSSPLANEFDVINLGELSDAKAASYVEKQLISKKLLKNKANAAFMLSKSEDVSIMLCEEDHIRINAFTPGQDLKAAYDKANELDDVFISAFKLAYSEKLGFLTASPMNVGTGMKASYVLHLPALKADGSIYRLSSMVGKLGLSLRELYSGGVGDIYVLSNQVSLGISEHKAIENLASVCDQIVNQERAARENLKEDLDLEDKIFRTLGIMKTARKLEGDEFLNYLSVLRLGKAMNLLDISYKTIGDLYYNLQNASIIAYVDKELDETTCAKARAEVVRKKLK